MGMYCCETESICRNFISLLTSPPSCSKWRGDFFWNVFFKDLQINHRTICIEFQKKTTAKWIVSRLSYISSTGSLALGGRCVERTATSLPPCRVEDVLCIHKINNFFHPSARMNYVTLKKFCTVELGSALRGEGARKIANLHRVFWA